MNFIFSRYIILVLFLKSSMLMAAQFNLTMSAAPEEGGTTEPAIGVHRVAAGSPVKVVAKPAPGWIFDKWGVSPGCGCNGNVTDKNAAETEVVLSNNVGLKAYFIKNLDETFLVTVGSVFVIKAESMGISEFLKKPKIIITDGPLGKKKKSIKVLNRLKEFRTGLLTEIRCELKRKVSAGIYRLLIYLKNKRGEEPINGALEVTGPKDLKITPENGGEGDKITLTCDYAGSAKPKLWLTYTDPVKGKEKKKRCKIEKPYAFSNARGKEGKSCMDVMTGESRLIFTVPKKITKDLACTVHLQSKVAEIQIKLNSAGGNITDVTAEQAVKLIQNNENNPDFIILDVRTSSEYVAEHIRNAVNLDYYSASFTEELAKLDKSKTYLVYCLAGLRSRLASEAMAETGFTTVNNLLGGINAFKEVGQDWIESSTLLPGY